MSETQPLIKRKKILIVTDSVLAKTGFGKAAKNYIEYLYKLNKFNIIHVAMGMTNADQEQLNRFPWTTYPAINLHQLQQIKQSNPQNTHENIDRMASYGAYTVDSVVEKEKPDCVIMTQDIWAFDIHIDKPWFKKLNPVIWTTLDSLPILPRAVEIAPKVKNYWSWASFATDAMHKLGHNHVKTLPGPINTNHFYRLEDKKRNKIRQDNKIDLETFIIGDVFRNQLRKSVPNMIEGFSLFKKENPTVKTKLFFHTHFSEGWEIPRLLNEFKISNNDLLTTYVCRQCGNYQIKPYTGQDLNCPHCKSEKSQITTNPANGINEEKLNEVYNTMDVFLHAFTSGGMEVPVFEAKLTEIPTLVTNYSCGEDSSKVEVGSLPLDYSEYREPSTQFIKSSTYPSSICKQLIKIYKLTTDDRRKLGKIGRKWVIDNYSIDKIGKPLEEFIDNAPFASADSFENKDEPKNPDYIIPFIKNDDEWILHMYHNILKMFDIDSKNEGFIYWKQKLSEGMPRNDIEEYFRKVAKENNQKQLNNTISFEDLLDKNDKGRILFYIPESAGDILLCTSLFKSIKERYPEWSLYVATKIEYKDILAGNKYMHRWLEYNQMMDNHLWCVGNFSHKGFFNIAFHPNLGTQKILNYLNGGEDRMGLELHY